MHNVKMCKKSSLSRTFKTSQKCLLCGQADGSRVKKLRIQQRRWFVQMNSSVRRHRSMPGDGKHFKDEHWRQVRMLRSATGVESARHSLIACTQHLHESTIVESGSLLKRLMQALQQAAPDSPRPFSLVSMKRRIKRSKPPLGLASIPQRSGVGLR